MPEGQHLSQEEEEEEARRKAAKAMAEGLLDAMKQLLEPPHDRALVQTAFQDLQTAVLEVTGFSTLADPEVPDVHQADSRAEHDAAIVQQDACASSTEQTRDAVVLLAAAHEENKTHPALEDDVCRTSSLTKQDMAEQDGVLEPAARFEGERKDFASAATMIPGPAKTQVDDALQESASTPQNNFRPLRHEQEHQYESPREPVAASEEAALVPAHGHLQSCSQPQPRPDEPLVAEKLSSAEPDLTKPEVTAEPQVSDILSTVTFTENPSFETWVPCDTSIDQLTRLSNVSFRGCEQSGLTLGSSCEFENVTFVNCKFDRTTFQRVKLSDVTFSHVVFEDTAFYQLRLQNVTLSKFRFTSDVWRSTYLEHALVGKDSFIKQPNAKRNYGLRSTAASSKTKRLTFKVVASLDHLKHTFCRSLKRDIHLFQPAPTGDILTRLAEHQNIIDHIMQYCFPGLSVHVYEYPYGSKKPAVSAKFKQLYGVLVRWEDMEFYSSPTLFGSLQPKTPVRTKPSGGNVPQRGVGNCTGLLTVNKAFSALALEHLYGRALHLQCRPEVAKAFLTVHAPRLKATKQLVLYYHWSEDKLMFTTHLDDWRHLLGTIRHEFSFIPNIRLHIGRSFWVFNTWSLGAQCVLDDIKCCPLSEAHKFAAPADRRRVKGDKSTHRADGTVLQIHIEGTTTPERIDFVRQLIDEVEKRRVGRPLFVRSHEGKEIIYRCADQFWESRRS
jgi:hypothetical protein